MVWYSNKQVPEDAKVCSHKVVHTSVTPLFYFPHYMCLHRGIYVGLLMKLTGWLEQLEFLCAALQVFCWPVIPLQALGIFCCPLHQTGISGMAWGSPPQYVVNVYWICTIYPCMMRALWFCAKSIVSFRHWERILGICENKYSLSSENRMESLGTRPLIPSCLGSFQVLFPMKIMYRWSKHLAGLRHSIALASISGSPLISTTKVTLEQWWL